MNVPAYQATPWQLFFGVSLKSKAAFYRELSTMLKVGMSLVQAVVTVAQAAVPGLSADMAGCLNMGMRFSDVLERYPFAFSPLDSALMKAGEESGQLEQKARRLAELYEAELDRRKQMWASLAYPLLVAHAGVFILTFPKAVQSCALAWLTTVACILIPAYVIALAFYICGRLAGLVPSLGRLYDYSLAWIPFIGKARMQLALGRWLDTFADLQEAGVPLTRNIELATLASGNTLLQARMAPLKEEAGMGLGRGLSARLAELNVMSPLTINMLKVGEETGDYVNMAREGAKMVKQEAEATLKALSSILPVILFVGMGILIAYTIVGMYSNILSGMQF